MQASHYVFIFIFLCHVTWAQSVKPLVGARAAGCAFTTSTLTDRWSLFSNPSGLANVTTSGLSASSIATQMPGASRKAVIMSTPLTTGHLGAGAYRFGDELYNEQMLTLAYANTLGLASLGTSANYVQYYTEGLGSKRLLVISFGGIANITDKVRVGAYISNVNQPRLSSIENEYLPVTMSVGIGFTPFEKLILNAEVEKDLYYPASIRAGYEYGFHKAFFIRSGFRLNPNTSYFGLGCSLQKFSFDYAIEYNTLTSVLHHVSLAYYLRDKRS